jgi:endoglucanase
MKNIATFAGSSPTNAIRIDMNAAYWNSSAPATTSGSYQQIIDAIVYYATQNNMLVILDYHWFNDKVMQQNMAPKDATEASIVFWKSVANKYKNYANVVFELYNEPYNLSYDTWLNGDSQWYGMQDLYNAVRSTGAKNLVIANGLDWGYYLGFLGQSLNNCNNNQTNCLVKDTSQSNGLAYNIAYGAHPYDSKGSIGYTYYPTGGGSPMPADFASNFAGVQNLYPLISTEFGDNQSSDYPPNNNNYIGKYTFILSALKQYGVHYTGFAWWIDPNQPYFPTIICGSWSSPEACFGGTYIRNDMISNPATAFNFGNK